MSIHDLHYLMPYITLSLGGLMVLLLGIIPWAVRLNLPFWCSVVITLFTANSAWHLMPHNRIIEGLVQVNHLSQGAVVFFSLITLGILTLSRGYRPLHAQDNESYYALILFSLCGMILIPAATNLIVFFIGIELMAISHFCLIAFKAREAKSLEAATKYLITAGVSAAFMMLGISFIYAGSGSLDITQITQILDYPRAQPMFVVIGFALLLVVIAFELAIAPFHFWLADVYQGGPVPIVASIGTIGKLALVGYCLVLSRHLGMVWQILQPIILTLALLSMVIGTLLALRQTHLKRLLAYSSVAHFGYLLVPFAMSDGDQYSDQIFSNSAILYYAISYALVAVSLLGCMSLIENRQPWLLDNMQGLGRRHPAIGMIMMLALLSLAGIPPLAGFFGKFIILCVAFTHHKILVMVIMVLTSAAALYYYLRIILALYAKPSTKQGQLYATGMATPLTHIHRAASAVPVIGIVLLIAMGFFVQPILHWLTYMVL